MHFGNIIKPVLFAALVHGYANPGSCSGACNVHDPTLIQRSSDKRYFRFSTGNKISYASASSINGPWTTIGSMLPSGSSIDLAGNDDLWVSIILSGKACLQVMSILCTEFYARPPMRSL